MWLLLSGQALLQANDAPGALLMQGEGDQFAFPAYAPAHSHKELPGAINLLALSPAKKEQQRNKAESKSTVHLLASSIQRTGTIPGGMQHACGDACHGPVSMPPLAWPIGRRGGRRLRGNCHQAQVPLGPGALQHACMHTTLLRCLCRSSSRPFQSTDAPFQCSSPPAPQLLEIIDQQRREGSWAEDRAGDRDPKRRAASLALLGIKSTSVTPDVTDKS